MPEREEILGVGSVDSSREDSESKSAFAGSSEEEWMSVKDSRTVFSTSSNINGLGPCQTRA